MSTVTLNASADFGYTGQYVARLVGRDSKFTFNREFVGSKWGKRGEGSSAEVDDPGIYECRDVTRKGKVDRYYVVAELDGELRKIRSDKADCMAIAKAVGGGRAFGEVVALSWQVPEEGKTERKPVYEILSAAAAAKSQQAATVDAVVEQCVAALSALDAKSRKAALAAIKSRLTEPAAAAAPEVSNGI